MNRAEAAKVGLSEAAIAQTVAAAFRGAPLGQVTLGGTPETVVLRVGAAPSTVDQVKALPLPTGGRRRPAEPGRRPWPRWRVRPR